MGVVALLSGGTAVASHHVLPKAHCNFAQVASSQGTQVTYGLHVNGCSTKWGMRRIRNVNLLYNASTDRVVDSTMTKTAGEPPFDNTKTFAGMSGTNYRARADVAFVLKQAPDLDRHRPQHWRDPGPECHVETTFFASDTLACRLLARVP